MHAHARAQRRAWVKALRCPHQGAPTGARSKHVCMRGGVRPLARWLGICPQALDHGEGLSAFCSRDMASRGPTTAPPASCHLGPAPWQEQRLLTHEPPRWHCRGRSWGVCPAAPHQPGSPRSCSTGETHESLRWSKLEQGEVYWLQQRVPLWVSSDQVAPCFMPQFPHRLSRKE